MHSYLVESQDGLDALMQKAGLSEQASPVQRDQLLVEVDGEHVEVDVPLQTLGLPQGH